MFDKKSETFLEEILKSSSPSGFEIETGRIYKKYLNSFCDKTYVDVMGNIVGVINEDADFKIMLAGHYDEIGFQVTHISDEGLLYFRKVGGIDKITLPGTQVEVMTDNGKINGVIGKKPIHLVSLKDRDNSLDIKDLWIDIGAGSKKEAENLVSIGDPIGVKGNFCNLLNDRITSKGIDNKIGVFTAAESAKIISMKKLKNIGLYCVGTVQEEIGCRGAQTSTFGIKPDVAFAIDVEIASDTPDINVKEVGTTKLGGGPILARNANENRVLGKIIRKLAAEKNIPYQEGCHSVSGGTDTAVIQLSGAGVASALIAIPTRYIHTPVEIVDMNDVKNAVKLITNTILSLDPKEEFIPF